MNQRVFPGDHPASVTFAANLAACLAKLERLPEALHLAVQAAEMARRALPEKHPTRVKCDKVLAQIRAAADQADTGEGPASRPP